VCRDDNIATFTCQLLRNSESLSLEPYGPVSACIRIAFTSAEDYCLLRCDTMSPVRSLLFCWRNGCIHIQGTRLHYVEENCRLLPILYQHLASFRHVLCILSFYPLIPCHLLPSSVPPPPIISSPLFLYYNNHVVCTLTPTPALPPTHFSPASSCCLPHSPWLCHPLPDISHLSFLHSIFFYYDDRDRKLDRLCGLVVKVSGYRYRGLGFDPRCYQIF
jgi:hypothetical protein